MQGPSEIYFKTQQKYGYGWNGAKKSHEAEIEAGPSVESERMSGYGKDRSNVYQGSYTKAPPYIYGQKQSTSEKDVEKKRMAEYDGGKVRDAPQIHQDAGRSKTRAPL